MTPKKTVCFAAAVLACAVVCALSIFLSFRRPFRQAVEKSGVSPALAYAVMKAESGFDENAESPAGAVGIMQLMPSTAEFVCRLYGIPFEAEKLRDGAYNTALGCRYLIYLSERFPVPETAIAAYNAGEGTVTGWLNDEAYSTDGITLNAIPYPETARYVKKVEKFRKIYQFLYH